ncbi:39S ribosomal protein L35, mitochondrial [Engraulis encrasicolus]|uniref:39S ribosomal protein L35, mitochondrial n=1 Tax=Engraulis encrasicolus TaxID=184585 RepID=UPI002FD50A6C
MAASLTRCVSGLARPLASLVRCPRVVSMGMATQQMRTMATILPRLQTPPTWAATPASTSLLQRVCPLVPAVLAPPVRTLTYYSLKYGKRKSNRSVIKRFKRLHCGLWLRRKAGYKKKIWKKMPARRKRLREHVICNKTQSRLLDKMTGRFWKRRNWYLNDPYLKYHDRVNPRW